MSDPLQLGRKRNQFIRPISWLILVGYLNLAVFTFVLIRYFPFFRNLFDSTKLLILVNAVWFSMGIVIYGAYALAKNWRRAQLSNLKIQLDTQFLLVMAFLLFGIKQILDLIVYLSDFGGSEKDQIVLAATLNTGKVLEFGGFMAGLLSIYFGRKKAE